ncbi:MAG: Tfp pilus assembly protein FimT/FimU [Kiritimatiellales bacterium]
MSRNRNSGFTMIELLVVLAIILIMTGVAVSTLSGTGTPKQQLCQEALDMTELFRAARLTAMERKLKVDVYADPATRTVCAVDSSYGRELLAETPEFFSDGVSLSDWEPQSNRFFRVTQFPEEIGIEPFSLSDIEPEMTNDDELFEIILENAVDKDEETVSRPVFSFTHLGGATGGGVSVARDDWRIDIACDLLTGLPEIVQRKAAE